MPMRYSTQPVFVDDFPIELREVMHYLYLPVKMAGSSEVIVPRNLWPLQPMLRRAIEHAASVERVVGSDYIYLSARKGWATADNPLNRPGWHADGFGTDDLNYVWWKGPGTRFTKLEWPAGIISDDHFKSMEQFGAAVDATRHLIHTPMGECLYMIDPHCVHATPLIAQGCWRQYVKFSFSRHRYNLENNSHNYLFDYDWPLQPRELLRNDPHKAGRDYA